MTTDPPTFPFLERPEYPASPEVLVSALAWSLFGPKKITEPPLGLVYWRESKKDLKTIQVAETCPTRTKDAATFCEALATEAGFQPTEFAHRAHVAESVSRSLQGTAPTKGINRPSSAMGVAGALLQNSVGSLAKARPPDFARIISTAFELGRNRSKANLAADLWYEAASTHAKSRQLAAIETALIESVLKPFIPSFVVWPPPRVELGPGPIVGALPLWWPGSYESEIARSPFGWFHIVWPRLCHPYWTERLAPRRWVGWATCLLRHAFAFTYLWESNFYLEIARGLLRHDSAEAIARRALLPARPLIPWLQGSVTEMNVDPGIKRMLATGSACREVVRKFAPDKSSISTLDAVISMIADALAKDPTGIDELSRAVATQEPPPALLAEAVRYALLARSTAETRGADDYGLLQVVSKRFTHVAPAPEWIVVMAAMSVPPGHSTLRLGDLISSLNSLGLRPRIDFLVHELERAGLCASAADGDEGITINLGFGGGS